MNTLRKSLFSIALLALFVSAAFGQSSMASTTLGAAITTTNQTTITLASTSTMLNAGPANQVNTVLYVDKEQLNVITVTDSTHVVASRHAGPGQGGIAMPHISGAKVWFAITTTSGPASSYFEQQPPRYGQCTRSTLLVVPRIYVATGQIFDCLGVTTAGQWVQTNALGNPVLGSTVASPAGVMTPTGTIFVVSGSNAITGITVPAGFAPGMSLYVVPSGTWTWTTATNIALAGTAVVNKTIIFTWNGTAWTPSVVA